VLAIRRDVIAVAMFDRDDTDRRPQEEGEAGEESGTDSDHCLQISSRLSEVKRASAFRARHEARSVALVIVLGHTRTGPLELW
jgi:hypothetical protein